MDEWEVSLDDAAGPPPAGPAGTPRWPFALLAVVVLAVGFLVWRPGGEPAPPAPPSVLGDHLAAPVKLRTPPGAVAMANGGYVGLRFQNYGSMLVTVPSEVVQPGGLRSALPVDPVAWLEQHPDVFVSRVRQVTVAGQKVTQLDYRRSRTAEPQSQFARLPLFCAASTECSRVTSNARVRATFVPVGGHLVLAEAVWRTDGTVTGRQMPAKLGKAYTELLASLTSSAGRAPSS